MLARRLQGVGVVLLLAGLAAHMFGWGWVLWLPEMFVDAVAALVESIRHEPLTYGVIAAGLALIILARVVGRR